MLGTRRAACASAATLGVVRFERGQRCTGHAGGGALLATLGLSGELAAREPRGRASTAVTPRARILNW